MSNYNKCASLLAVSLAVFFVMSNTLQMNSKTIKITNGRNLRSIHYDRHYQLSRELKGGYFNLSCPFEWSKYSCAYRQRTWKDADMVRRSTNYYLKHLEEIHSVCGLLAAKNKPIRVFFTGDSLMRQLFIGIACNAYSCRNNIIEQADIPWKDDWFSSKAKNFEIPLITSGQHSGFDAASIRLSSGFEMHFVPHHGFKDEYSSEEHVLDRLADDILKHQRVTFGTKTAVPQSPDTHVDILIYNVGILSSPDVCKKNIDHFAKQISKPLMSQQDDKGKKKKKKKKNRRNKKRKEEGSLRTKSIYSTTPTQHFNTTDNGQWGLGNMNVVSRRCIAEVPSNPRADIEKILLQPGINVDALLDYDDLQFGKMHVRNGDCSHYCMPGVPDVVASRLLKLCLEI